MGGPFSLLPTALMTIDVPAAWHQVCPGDLRGQALWGSGEGEAQGIL